MWLSATLGAARPPYICAHGGAGAAAGGGPPNTLRAIYAAARAGADCVELDASPTADGRLVALHDRDVQALLRLNATAGGAGGAGGGGTAAGAARAADLPLAALLALSWPGGERPLEFGAAAAAALEEPRIELAILDLKGESAAAVPELLRAAAAAGCGGGRGGGAAARWWRRWRWGGGGGVGARCLVWGKSDEAMLEVKRLAPWQPAGYVVMLPPDQFGAVRAAAGAPPRGEAPHATLHPYEPLRLPGMAVAGAWHGVAGGALAARLRAAGQLLIAWTLDTPEDLARVLDEGADGVVASDEGRRCRGGSGSGGAWRMPHFICRWPCGDVLLASVDSREDLDAILQERSEPGVCKVARYHGPLVLELKPLVPLVFRGSASAFKLEPPCPAFAPAWPRRASGGDVRVVAADGASEPAHRVVLQCRLPALQKASWGPDVDEIRMDALADAATLSSFLEFLYTDDVPSGGVTHALHVAALRCHVPRLAAVCERRFAQQLEEQMGRWGGLAPTQQAAALDSLLEWARYAEALSRVQLLELCVHLAAQRLPAVRTRPSWRQLPAKTQRLVELAAVATSPPLVHRSLEADGAPAAAAAEGGGGAAGQQQLAAMSIEAESYAHAGGRMTQAEWQALNTYRAAVGEAQTCPQASPLAITGADLRACGLAAEDQQRFPFEVKAPTLAPFKRLMDSVCRFAFPSVHGALAALKQERERLGPAAPGAADVDGGGDDDGAIEAAFVGATEGIRMRAAAGALGPRAASHAAAAASGRACSTSDGSTETAPHAAAAAAAPAGGGRVGQLQRQSGWGSSDMSHSSAAAELPAAHPGQQQQRRHRLSASAAGASGEEWEEHLSSPAPAAEVEAGAEGEDEHMREALQPPQQQQQQQVVGPSHTAPSARDSVLAPAAAGPLVGAAPSAGAARLSGEAVAAAAAASSALRARREAAAAAAVAARPALLQLQRALVDDFVLYDDSSAARLHLVGQVVAVERGDPGAAARLLAPANADLFAYISTGSRQGGGQRACSALPGFVRAAAGVTSAAVVAAAGGAAGHQHTFAPEALAAAQQGSVSVRQANPPASELETMLQQLQAPPAPAIPAAPAAAAGAPADGAAGAAPSTAAGEQQHAAGGSPAQPPQRRRRQQLGVPGSEQQQPEQAPAGQLVRRSPRLQAAAGTAGAFHSAPASPGSSPPSAPATAAAAGAAQAAAAAPEPQQQPSAAAVVSPPQQQQQQPQPQAGPQGQAPAPGAGPRLRPAPLRLSRLLDGVGGVLAPLFAAAADGPHLPPPPLAPPAEAGALVLPRLLPEMPVPTEQQLAAQVMAAPLARGAGQPQALPPGAALPAQLPAAAAAAGARGAGAAAGARGSAGGAPAGAMAFGSILAAINGGGAGAAAQQASLLAGAPPPGAAGPPGAAAGRPGAGAPALLAGGLLSEGGVGEWGETAEFEASLRRITCHGLMELCAALAQPPAPPHMPAADAAPGAGAGGAAAAGGLGGGAESESAAEEERTPRVGGGGCMALRTTLSGRKRRLSE
ncbi:MAG: hypothetical protein J3K34DRAFT_522200 [Monoraphidium minutum]|nr:MAG: hypothetical protein J3K34DRAFT_522200 [Monoraphidium minutum]